MSLSDILIIGFGMLAQIMFFGRTIIQWIMSERAGKLLSPTLFWQISLIASIMYLVYGIMRNDFAIILGQFLTFFIYIRNLQLKNEWKKLPKLIRIIAPLLPIVSIAWMVFSGNYSLSHIISTDVIAKWLLIFGISAQLIFTFRFIYQWIVAEKAKESVLPVGFWYISLAGGLLISVYAIFRRDPVTFIGNFGGCVMYSRNIVLHYTGKGLFDLLPFDLGVVKRYLDKK